MSLIQEKREGGTGELSCYAVMGKQLYFTQDANFKLQIQTLTKIYFKGCLCRLGKIYIYDQMGGVLDNNYY